MSIDIVTSSRTDWFVKSRFGMFIHWGTYSLAARHEWVKNIEQIPDADYQRYFDRFNPDLYDARQWARAARQAGMQYAVLTTKHHEGFCLWDTAYTDYKATRTRIGRDLVREYVDACRAEGLRVGFYYSLIDWHHPDFTVDRHHPMRNNPAERAKNAQRDMRRYAQYMRDQVAELLTNYGQIDIMWFDFSYPGEDGKGHQDWESDQLLALIRRLQPDILIDNRLDLPGSGDFVTPEQYQPTQSPADDNGRPLVWEACQTFSGAWGYTRDEYSWREPAELLGTLIDCVAKGGNLLLNVGPTARGEFDRRAQSRLDAFAEWMHSHERSIRNCGQAPAEFACPPGCKLTWNPAERCLYLHVLAWPYKDLHLEGQAWVEQLAYAQFLHDASELRFSPRRGHLGISAAPAIRLALPQVRPDTLIPVIELFLK